MTRPAEHERLMAVESLLVELIQRLARGENMKKWALRAEPGLLETLRAGRPLEPTR